MAHHRLFHATAITLARLVLAGGLVAWGGPMVEALAQTQAQTRAEIVRLADRAPKRSIEQDPSSAALIETWLDAYGWDANKHFDKERYEILDRRVVWRDGVGRATLQFRVLGLDGDAMAFAAARCPGRNRPVEAQIVFSWTTDPGNWYETAGRGDPAQNACVDEVLWTEEQVTLIVDPPPLPVPPTVSQAEVVTPTPGSPERKAILDALRPSFEKLFGPPIEFDVHEMKVAAGFAWVAVHPQRPGGREISQKDWDAGVGPCQQLIVDGTAQFWMRMRDGAWTVGWGTPTGVCASDSIGGYGYLIGAPPQLVEQDTWGDAAFMPIEDPQYFDLWKK